MFSSSVCSAIPQSRRHAWLRRLILAFIAAVVLETWFVAGGFPSVRIEGGSMAPQLLGRHAKLRCRECGAPFVCDAELANSFPRVVCPNCGYADRSIDSPAIAAGDLILVDRTTFALRSPKRWEVIAFRPDDRAEQLFIKRAVGLPGETVSLRDGDVYIDGRVQRKELPVQKAVATLVYDADHSLAEASGAAELHTSRWIATKAGEMSNNYANSDVLDMNWLEFRHGLAYSSNASGAEKAVWKEAPIEDLSSYYPQVPRREENVHAVDDLMLTFRCERLRPNEKIVVLAKRRNRVFMLSASPVPEIPADLQVQISENGQVIFKSRLENASDEGDWTISLFDRQLLCAIKDRPFFVKQIDDDSSTAPVALRPFAVGFRGSESPFRLVRVWRDVYYGPPVGMTELPERRLADDEFYVLGDNSPVSEDSRIWQTPGQVVYKHLLGKPLCILWPFRGRGGGLSRFPVPDFDRLGYIR